MRWSLLLWATFIPAVAISVYRGFDTEKPMLLFSTSLICVIFPAIVGSSKQAQSVWLRGQVIAGLALGAGALAFPAKAATELDRLDIEGGSTIGTSRSLGAVIVLMVAFAMLANGRLIRRGVCVIVATAAMVLMISIGSKGPIVAVAVAIPLVLLTARLAPRTRLVGLVMMAPLAVFVVFYTQGSTTGGSRRVLALLTGDGGDQIRASLYDKALTYTLSSPSGLGWGGFARLPGTAGHYPHNIVLEVFVEAGWLAGAAFLVYCISSLIRLRRGADHGYGLPLYGLAMYWLLAAQFSSDVNGNRITWAALAFGFSAAATYMGGRGTTERMSLEAEEPAEQGFRSSACHDRVPAKQ